MDNATENQDDDGKSQVEDYILTLFRGDLVAIKRFEENLGLTLNEAEVEIVRRYVRPRPTILIMNILNVFADELYRTGLHYRENRYLFSVFARLSAYLEEVIWNLKANDYYENKKIYDSIYPVRPPDSPDSLEKYPWFQRYAKYTENQRKLSEQR